MLKNSLGCGIGVAVGNCVCGFECSGGGGGGGVVAGSSI